MCRQPVPQYQELAAELAQQMAEKVDHLSGADGVGIEAEVEVKPGNPGGRRQLVPVEVVLQYRGLAARCPGAYPMGPFAQSALVDEDDGAPLRQGFFLIRGHSTFFQRAIRCSSRSSARPLGRWQLQLSRRNRRHTCEGSYRTAYCCSISFATRPSVHSPLLYPKYSAPCCSQCSTCRSSVSLSLGGRPARAARCSPARPAVAKVWAQRLTDWRLTPKRRATSASLWPRSSSRAAVMRRCSNSTRSRRIPRGNPITNRLIYVTLLFKYQ